jgi:protein O-GlcNAc transferase
MAAESWAPGQILNQGLDDTRLLAMWGRKLCDVAANRYPYWQNPRASQQGDRIRLGVISRFLETGSPAGWVKDLMGRLRADQFELRFYNLGNAYDSTSNALATIGSYTLLDPQFESAAAFLHDERLDAILYPDLGLHPATNRLAACRFAPLQIAGWGNPATSGLPTIDWYLSSEHESDQADQHYTERLIRLPGSGVVFPRPVLMAGEVTRHSLGIPEGVPLFHCAHSPGKHTPAYDLIFHSIQARVPNAWFLFQSDARLVHRHRRLKNSRYLPPLSRADFAGLCSISTVLLSPPAWAAANVAVEAIAHGLPVVTLPGALMRQRHALAYLNQAQCPFGTAQSVTQYIDRAVALATEPELNKEERERLSRRSGLLFNDFRPTWALENLLKERCK